MGRIDRPTGGCVKSSWLAGVLALTAALLIGGCSGPALPAASPEAGSNTTEPPTLEASVTPRSITAPLSESQARALMEDLGSVNPETAAQALDVIVEQNDERFVPVLIELMRATEVGIAFGSGYQETVAALEQLSGQAFGANWPAWVEWYGGTDLAPPAGFSDWKGRLLGRIDPGFAEFLREDVPSRLRMEEVVWGGVTVDGIPALDQPEVIPADDADYLEPGEPVFGISLNGEARAYPLRIMDWHEMVNDVVGGVPVSLAYCTLCGAGVAYDGRGPDGVVFTFGSSGLLYRSNKLMYDRQTRSLWNQLSGEPVHGELAGQELRLELLPVVLTSWEDWRSQHPDTLVLNLGTGYERVYFPGAAYGDYFSSEATMFPVWQRSAALDDKARIYALQIDGIPKAYPIERLVEERVVNDELAGQTVVLIAASESIVVDGISLRTGAVRYDSGAEVRAYERGGHQFSPGETEATVLDENGRIWDITEEALLGPEGEQLERLPGHLAYWFGWFAFYPQTEVYGLP